MRTLLLVLLFALPAFGQERFPVYDETRDPPLDFTLKSGDLNRTAGVPLIIIAPVATMKRLMPEWAPRLPDQGTAFAVVIGREVKRAGAWNKTSGRVTARDLGLPENTPTVDLYWADSRMEVKRR